MDNKDNQIEEMVFALNESQHEFDKAWKECLHNNGKMPDRENVFYAKYLIEQKGYRKSTEVAEEIFGEIEKCRVVGVYGVHGYRIDDIAELKKKYIGEDTNVPTNECDGNCFDCEDAIWRTPQSFVGDSRIIGCKRLKESEDTEL